MYTYTPNDVRDALGLSEAWDVESLDYAPGHSPCGPVYGLIPDGPGAFQHCFGCGNDFPYPDAYIDGRG